MKFISYPTARDRQAQTAGRVLAGDVISNAPPSGVWVFVQEEARFYRVFGTATHPAGGEFLKSAIETEATPAQSNADVHAAK